MNKELLNDISVLGSFMFVFGSVSILFALILYYVPGTEKKLFWRVSVRDALSIVLALLFIIFCVDFERPY